MVVPYPNLFRLGYGCDPNVSWLPTSLGSSLAAWYKADAGCYTDAAMSCASASSQYVSRTSEAALQAADVDFSFACYFKPASADRMFIAGKGDGNGTGEEWWLEFTALGAIYFGFGSAVSSNGAQSAGTYSPGDPLFIVGTYTQATGVGRVYVNGSLVGTSNALGAAHVSSSAPLSIGRDGQYNGLYTNGVVGRAGLWIGRVLAAGDVTSLYNAGAGKFYADLTTAEKVSLVEYWNLCEASGDRVGLHAGLNLTPTNGPTVAAGPGEGLCVNGSPCKRSEDQSGNARHRTQSTIGYQPIWTANFQNGLPALVYDSVDDYMACAGFTFSQPCAYGLAGSVTDGRFIIDSDSGTNSRVLYRESADTELGMFAGSVIGGTVPTMDTFRSYVAQFDGVSSYGDQDGAQVAAGDVGASNGTGVVVGVNAAKASNFSQVNEGALVLASRRLTAAERTSLHNWQKSRYGTP